MSETSSINTLIGTFSSISDINTRTVDPCSNLICIDTSNNRIGINTIDPSYSIHIQHNGTNANGIYTPMLIFDLSRLPLLEASANKGQVYYDVSGYLKIKLY